MRRLGAGRIAAVVLTVAVLAPLGVTGGRGQVARAAKLPTAELLFDDEFVTCVQPTPSSAAAPTGGPIFLNVAVLADGVNALARTTSMEVAAESFRPLGIEMRTVRVDDVRFNTTNASRLIDMAKAHFGGKRPAGVDLVLVLSGKDIEENAYPGMDGKNTIGLADCIGGMRFAEHAFAVVEVMGSTEWVGRTIAHELGHLAGAHHHYANCAEGVTSEILELTPCSLMVNFVNFASRNFSVANAAVVRGYVEDFGLH